MGMRSTGSADLVGGSEDELALREAQVLTSGPHQVAHPHQLHSLRSVAHDLWVEELDALRMSQ